MNFKNLHEMSKYFEGMTHKGFDKHMGIYGNGNNGLGYKPYGHLITGGALDHPSFDINDRHQLERAEKAYKKGIEELKERTDYTEEEREKDIKLAEKYIRGIERKILQLDNEEIEEQMKYYEDNYDNLDEEEKEIYLQMLAQQHEELGHGETKDITDNDKKIHKVVKDLEEENNEYKRGYHYEDEHEFETFEDETENFDNKLFNDTKKEVINLLKPLKGSSIYWSEYNKSIGNIVEEKLINYPNLFDYIKHFNDKLYNTSNENCKYYTPEILQYNELSKKENLKKDKHSQGRDILGNYKLDYMLNDYITDNTIYELKSLSRSYNDYKSKGSINLVANKITGETGEFKPIYKSDNNGNIKLENIYDTQNGKTFKVYKNDNLDYKVIFFLTDGIYYYEPLKDKNFKIDKNGRGRLLYDKIYKDYDIPIDKLIKVPQRLINQIIK